VINRSSSPTTIAQWRARQLRVFISCGTSSRVALSGSRPSACRCLPCASNVSPLQRTTFTMLVVCRDRTGKPVGTARPVLKHLDWPTRSVDMLQPGSFENLHKCHDRHADSEVRAFASTRWLL
jgi:hypothetical protein